MALQPRQHRQAPRRHRSPPRQHRRLPVGECQRNCSMQRKAAGFSDDDVYDDDDEDSDTAASAHAADAAAAPPIEPYFGANGEATSWATSLSPLPGFETFRANSATAPPCSRWRGNLLPTLLLHPTCSRWRCNLLHAAAAGLDLFPLCGSVRILMYDTHG